MNNKVDEDLLNKIEDFSKKFKLLKVCARNCDILTIKKDNLNLNDENCLSICARNYRKTHDEFVTKVKSYIRRGMEIKLE